MLSLLEEVLLVRVNACPVQLFIIPFLKLYSNNLCLLIVQIKKESVLTSIHLCLQFMAVNCYTSLFAEQYVQLKCMSKNVPKAMHSEFYTCT